MAENKKSFLLYCDLIHTVSKMPNDKAGELFKHILEYVNDENPETDDLIIKLTFEPIKQQLKRDLGKWSEMLVEKSNAGRIGNLKRWHPDLHKQLVSKEITIEEAENIAKNRTAIKLSHPVAKIAVTVNDNVNVNDTVNDTVIKDKVECGLPPPPANPDFLKFVFWIKENAPAVGKMKEPFTEAQFFQLKKDFSSDQIKQLLQSMHNYQPLLKKNINANLTFRNWAKKEFTPQNFNHERKQSVSDKAATGIELAKAALAKSLNKIATERGFNNSA
jgi:hypothetical protein